MKDLRAFLGLASYYRRFIKSFSTIAAPLNKLSAKGVNFRWSSECQTAFDSLKSALVSAPILGYPNSHDTLYLDCDASSVGIGAVLSQVHNCINRPSFALKLISGSGCWEDSADT